MDAHRCDAHLPLEGPALTLERLMWLAGATCIDVSAGRSVGGADGSAGIVGVVLDGALVLWTRRARDGPEVPSIVGRGDPIGLEWLPKASGCRAGWCLGGSVAIRTGSRALVRSRVAVLPAERFDAALQADTAFASWVASAAAERCVRLSDRLVSALTQPVEARLLAELRDLATRHGRVRADASVRIELPLTQDLLASLVGASRESVNRALRRLRQRGEIRWARRTYEVAGSSEAARERLRGAALTEVDP